MATETQIDTDELNCNDHEGAINLHKVHISRVPVRFDEHIVKRILEDELGTDSVIEVTLIYPKPEECENDKEMSSQSQSRESQEKEEDKEKIDKVEHRGFGFVALVSGELQQKAIELQTIRGGRKVTSKRKYTIYLRPYTENDDEKQICFLWSQKRCPYGDECKFKHWGEGACLVVDKNIDDKDKKEMKRKKQKCFTYKKKGKCKLGDKCPFSHDFTPKRTFRNNDNDMGQSCSSEKKEIDCINWKTKGKCRKRDTCPYRHEESVREAFLQKINDRKKSKKRKNVDDEDNKSKNTGDKRLNKKQRSSKKHKQPLCVRVFGLSYETKEQDIHDFFADCGPIMEITFPTFPDSGRSKGYCGVLFKSPKAVEKAIELDGSDLLGRWLQIQEGKMLLQQWEDNERERRYDGSRETQGEYGYDPYQ